MRTSSPSTKDSPDLEPGVEKQQIDALAGSRASDIILQLTIVAGVSEAICAAVGTGSNVSPERAHASIDTKSRNRLESLTRGDLM